jgi:hypothetical protein
MERSIAQRGLRKFAFRLYELLADMVKCVDVEDYRLFTAINLKLSKDWTSSFLDVSKEEQALIQEASEQFSQVISVLRFRG